MSDEQIVTITLPSVPGTEMKHVTLGAFNAVWAGLGWEITTDEEIEDLPYLISSLEKGAPFGVATLDADGHVEQLATGSLGGVDTATMNAAIADAIAAITPASIGALPDTLEVVTLNNGVFSTPMISGHPAPNGQFQWYGLTNTQGYVQGPLGSKTQLVPGYDTPSIELATEKTVNSLTLSTVLSAQIQPSTVYGFEVLGTYESTVAASGERLRITFDPPPGSTGFYGVQSMNSAGAASGTLAPSWVAKKLTETFDLGGSGAAQPRWFRIVGTVYTDAHNAPPDAESNFDFRARLSTVDGAGVPLVPAKIYGSNTADYDATRMTLTRLS